MWGSSRGDPLKKLAYAVICGVHTVFFSKRRKNSSLCAHRAAAWFWTKNVLIYIATPRVLEFLFRRCGTFSLTLPKTSWYFMFLVSLRSMSFNECFSSSWVFTIIYFVYLIFICFLLSCVCFLLIFILNFITIILLNLIFISNLILLIMIFLSPFTN